MKRFGLSDALGFVGALVAVAWLPNSFDPMTPAKLLVLAAGGACVAPAVVVRWRSMGRPMWPVMIPCVAVVMLVLWGAISWIATAAPFWDALFGWWGRGDGWLAWLSSALLLLGAVTLSTREVQRTITWLLGGATVVVIIGMLQVAGVSIAPGNGGPVVGLMGNTNFAAGYFAILALLALGRALTPVPLWHRLWAGVLFLSLAFLAWATTALQGPAALAAGVVAFVIAYGLLYRGPHRKAGLIAVGALVLLCLVALVLSLVAVGPIASLWRDSGFVGRQMHWGSGLRILAGEPWFGTGPGGFTRYVSEYRPESYLQARGPFVRISASHNIALQFGAVLGFPGLILWLLAFLGTAFALTMRIVRAPVISIGLTASVAAAFTTFLVQGMVSIDMLPLLATGWLIAGLALACAREPMTVSGSIARRSASSTDLPPESSGNLERSSTARWIPVVGGIAGIAVAIVVGTQVSLSHRLWLGLSPDQMLTVVTDPKTPCLVRSQIAQQLPLALSPGISSAAIMQSTEIDRRCPPMIMFAAQVAVSERILPLAGTYTADAVAFDPLLDSAWVMRGRYFLGAGDIPAAEAAAAEARRVLALYPEDSITPRSIAEIDALLLDILRAQGQSP